MKKTTHVMITLFILVLSFVFISGEQVLWPQEEKTDTEKKEKQKKKEDKKEDKEKALHYEVTVTATRTKKDTFETPKPVSVINRKKLVEKAPNNITELLTELPGVDVNGVGANQSRPVVRGFRGQRILIMEDGIRMNNSRRQQDFGEIPALVDISELDRIEVVRGPASVLYGSDAIGGVVNMITRIPDFKPGTSEIHGNIGYRYSSADKQNKALANFNGNIGKLGFMISGNFRNAKNYTAPAGTFGDIDLIEDVEVIDTGVKDGSLNVQLSYNISDQNQFSFKYEYYKATDTGFGLVEPDIYDPGSARVQIGYPDQNVQKYTVKYENRKLGFVLADHVSFTGYHMSNERDLSMNIWIPFNIPLLPDAGISLDSANYSDVDTLGFRLEFNKGFTGHVFTYGIDFFNDRSNNTDSSTTTVIGFGPPHPSIDTTPQVPNATYRSMGIFFQDDIALFKRASLILGVRYQTVNAKTKETVGLEGEPLYDSTDSTLVGAANLIYGVTDQLKLVFSVGRGFRSPNLIERFFNGVTPEGSGFQSRNTELEAETSLNFDVGFKYRYKGIYLESTYFHNTVKNGIRISPTGREINGIPEWTNVNVDELRMQGIELLGKVYFDFGVSAMANYTKINSKDLGRPETPYVDTYSSKFNFNLRYDQPKGLFWVGYDLRVNGKQKEVDLGKNNPIGDFIPGFTVHSLSAGVTLFKHSKYPQQIGIIIGNLTNELYSEFSNASFFRPAPKRHVVLTWNTSF
jgi:outer membrane receptor protein involved in Fe transport